MAYHVRKLELVRRKLEEEGASWTETFKEMMNFLPYIVAIMLIASVISAITK